MKDGHDSHDHGSHESGGHEHGGGSHDHGSHEHSSHESSGSHEHAGGSSHGRSGGEHSGGPAGGGGHSTGSNSHSAGPSSGGTGGGGNHSPGSNHSSNGGGGAPGGNSPGNSGHTPNGGGHTPNSGGHAPNTGNHGPNHGSHLPGEVTTETQTDTAMGSKTTSHSHPNTMGQTTDTKTVTNSPPNSDFSSYSDLKLTSGGGKPTGYTATLGIDYSKGFSSPGGGSVTGTAGLGVQDSNGKWGGLGHGTITAGVPGEKYSLDLQGTANSKGYHLGLSLKGCWGTEKPVCYEKTLFEIDSKPSAPAAPHESPPSGGVPHDLAPEGPGPNLGALDAGGYEGHPTDHGYGSSHGAMAIDGGFHGGEHLAAIG